MRKKCEKCVQYEKTSYLCPPVCRAGECGKIWTACNHNKKSLKQHIFYFQAANFSHFIRLTIKMYENGLFIYIGVGVRGASR